MMGCSPQPRARPIPVSEDENKVDRSVDPQKLLENLGVDGDERL